MIKMVDDAELRFPSAPSRTWGLIATRGGQRVVAKLVKARGAHLIPTFHRSSLLILVAVTAVSALLAACSNPGPCETEADCADVAVSDCESTACIGGECVVVNEEAGTACGDREPRSCDAPDTCDGEGACLANHFPPTEVCRVARDECDTSEFCDGQGRCPADEFASSGTACGDAASGVCDRP